MPALLFLDHWRGVGLEALGIAGWVDHHWAGRAAPIRFGSNAREGRGGSARIAPLLSNLRPPPSVKHYCYRYRRYWGVRANVNDCPEAIVSSLSSGAIHLVLGSAIALTLCAGVGQVHGALPAGRAWSPPQTLLPEGYWYLAAPRLERDTSGLPSLYAAAPMRTPTDAHGNAFGYRWADTTWRQTWQVGEGTLITWPVQSPRGHSHVLWSNAPTPPLFDDTGRMMLAEVLGDSLCPSETVATGPRPFHAYSGAITPRARWIAMLTKGPDTISVMYSEPGGPWRPVRIGIWAQEAVAVGAIDDTTALIAWPAGFGTGLRWGTLQRDHYTQDPIPIPELWSNEPRFRRRPSGGQWLAWGTNHPEISLASYRSGAWSAPETLRCAYRDTVSQHWSYDPDLSRDDDDPENEYPVVVWSSSSGSASVDANICLCVPTDSGFTERAEELDFAINGVLPGVIRDRNGDIWVAWWMSNYSGSVRWTHTYTSATTDTPTVAAAGRLRQVRWSLSAPAPRSWWAVERAIGGGDFVQMARVRAGPDSLMSWTDDTAPAGVVRYRIRRECVDRRYEWLSAESRWPAHGLGPRVLRVSANPAAAQVSFEVVDAAAGALEVRLHDLQGRVVWRERRQSAGAGRDAFVIDVPREGGRIRPGVYFLRARDALGHESETAKVAVLR